MNDKYITVSQLTRYIKYRIDNDENLNQVFLKGEISNFKAHSRGHYYFTLKDEGSRIHAVMFASSTSKLPFMPTDGMKVLVTGKVSIYEVNGGYQLYVNDMIEDGIGNLYVAYEQLRAKLEKEGLFDSSKKKKIPKIPNAVGVITAPTGAAIRDIVCTIKRRWPLANILLFPSLVQGREAAPSIVTQLKRAERYDLDVLIVGRGGGSIEDMWCFNDEEVARTIFHCSIPTISAVGHEVDFTIADFVADLRAPTPTGAAEMAVPNIVDVNNYFQQLILRSKKTMKNKVDFYRQRLENIRNTNILKNPIHIYQVKEQQFDNLLDNLKFHMKELFFHKKEQYNEISNHIVLKNPFVLIEKSSNKYLQLISKLETLSPLLTIKRGYAIVRKDNKIITSKKEVQKEDEIVINLMDGDIKTKVI